MTALKKLTTSIEQRKSYLCVGLDLDQRKIPNGYRDSIKNMCKFALRIVDATKDIVAAYKPNLAFYEALGPDGLFLLRQIISRIPEDIPVIIDGKRGDIGNTAQFYAKACYDIYRADWVTLNPYMGYDSIRPFLEVKDKGVFILCLTSNPGARDFQRMEINNKPIYLHVANKVEYWNKDNNCGLVVGATHPEQLESVRRAAASMPILIPGVGAQGGDLEAAIVNGTDSFRKPALINVSRSVLYASEGEDFDQAARQAVEKINNQITGLQNQHANA
jgi:orotidine-5'-phosphate decarboxylase